MDNAKKERLVADLVLGLMGAMTAAVALYLMFYL